MALLQPVRGEMRMGGISGRTFEQWIFRRKINLKEWLENHSIKTIDELNEWCKKSNLLLPTSPVVLSHLQAPIATEAIVKSSKKKVKQSLKKRRSSKQADEVIDKAWHTPAAERPRRKKK